MKGITSYLFCAVTVLALLVGCSTETETRYSYAALGGTDQEPTNEGKNIERPDEVRVFKPEALGRLAIQEMTQNPSHIGFGVISSAAYVQTMHRNDTIEIIVLPSADKKSQQALLHMRNKDWQKALGLFRQASADDPNDDRCIFGMGVCFEKVGDNTLESKSEPSTGSVLQKYRASIPFYESALERYKAAVLIRLDSKYEISRDRAEMKIQTVSKYSAKSSVNPAP